MDDGWTDGLDRLMGLVGGWMDGIRWMDRLSRHGWVDGWTAMIDSWMGELMDGWMDGWMSKCIDGG